MAKRPWTQVGSIRKSKAGKIYLKFDLGYDKETRQKSSKNLRELAEALSNAGEDGLTLSAEKPTDKLRRLREFDIIKSDEELEAALAKVPDFIKYELCLPNDDQ